MVHPVVLRFVIVAGLAAPAAARAEQAAAPTCSMDVFETTAAAVIEPCTKEIARTDLTPDARATAFYVRGRGYHRTGRIDLAAQDYDVAIKLAPNRADFYVHRANIAFRHYQFDDGNRDLMRALTLDPRNATAYRMLGGMYKDAGYTDKALEFFGQALTIDPAEPYALMDRSNLLMRLHRFDEALRDADAMVAIPAPVINRLGYVNERARLEDFHVVALTHRAELEIEVGKRVEAERDFDAAVAAKWSTEALVPRGEHRLVLGDQLDAAAQDLAEAVRLDPDDYRAQYDFGMALFQQKHFAPALAAFGTAATLRPYQGNALRMQARVERELGQTEAAVTHFERASRIDPLVRQSSHFTLVAAGYLTEASGITASAADLHTAVQACMLDPTCN